MKVFLIGANGQVGKYIVKLLQGSNKHELTAMVRNEEQAEQLKQSGVNVVVTSLDEEKTYKKIIELVSGKTSVEQALKSVE